MDIGELLCPDLFTFYAVKDFLRFFGVVPKVRPQGYFLFRIDRLLFGIDVKDASSGKLFYPLNPEYSLWSCRQR
jgi:hypothetical protein